MTDLLYTLDSYLKVFSANVVEISGSEVILDKTAFYPGGGGQPCDMGVLRTPAAAWVVTSVKKTPQGVAHHIEGGLPNLHETVTGELDWDRRHALMRTHTALHILCGVMFRDFASQVTGGNMEPLRARMDFELENLSPSFCQEMEARVNQEVTAGRPVHVRVLPREEAFRIPDLIRTKINLLPEGISEVRTVEIEGLDLQADGGTHVANTREVGYVRIAGYENKGRINKRLRIEVLDIAPDS